MVKKIVVQFEEPFNDPILPENDTRRELVRSIASSAAMTAAMSIPGYLYQAHFSANTTIHSRDARLTGFQKLAHAGSYKNQVLDDCWNQANSLVCKIGFLQQTAGQFAVEAEFWKGKEVIGHYVFIIKPDGEIGLLIC